MAKYRGINTGPRSLNKEHFGGPWAINDPENLKLESLKHSIRREFS